MELPVRLLDPNELRFFQRHPSLIHLDLMVSLLLDQTKHPLWPVRHHFLESGKFLGPRSYAEIQTRANVDLTTHLVVMHERPNYGGWSNPGLLPAGEDG